MATKEEILDSISSMTVLELSELLKDFEERFGVTAAAPVALKVFEKYFNIKPGTYTAVIQQSD